jgi:hypothetical protein
MPPLPTSLIVVGLVAAWLVVLVPMVARRREHVPESDEGSAGFRVLRRASASLRRRPVMSRTAVEADPELADDDLLEPEEHWDQDDWESDGWDTDREEVAEAGDDALGGDDIDGGDDPEGTDRDDDGPMDVRDDEDSDQWQSGAEPTVHDAADEWTAEHPSRRREEWAADPRAWRGDEWDDRASRRGGGGPVRSRRVAEPAYAEHDYPESRYPEPGYSDSRHAESRYTEPRRIDVPRSRASQPGRDRIAGPDPEWRADERLRPVPLRPGRGGFDPEAAEQARAYRYRRRRRIAMALLAIAAVCAVLGVLGIMVAWAGAAVAAVLLALYLAYLRRQVRIEESIRQRRAARLERARQIRPVYRASVAEQVRAHRTGGLPRPVTDDDATDGYRVVSHARPSAASVPPAHYGPGVVVDLDDDDPAFDDLEYYRPVTYRRAAGE